MRLYKNKETKKLRDVGFVLWLLDRLYCLSRLVAKPVEEKGLRSVCMLSLFGVDVISYPHQFTQVLGIVIPRIKRYYILVF